MTQLLPPIMPPRMPQLIDRSAQLIVVADSPAPHQIATLAPSDDPYALRDHLADLVRIDVEFPHFTDGRGYSSATVLRKQMQWQGELRAVGDVQVDQLGFLARCGFDTFALRDDQSLEQARSSLAAFSHTYQASHPL